MCAVALRFSINGTSSDHENPQTKNTEDEDVNILLAIFYGAIQYILQSIITRWQPDGTAARTRAHLFVVFG